jgi:dipeptidase E
MPFKPLHHTVMKLYLSSMMIGNHPERLLAMSGGKGARMAVVTNALDYISFEDRLVHAQTKFDPMIYFGDAGFDPSIIDLRNYFGRSTDLERVLSRHQVVWALGGNAFLLRRAMQASGFDIVIHDLLEEGLVYGGWSAGACVAGNSLRPIAIMDEPEKLAAGYPDIPPIWEGMGLVRYAVIPHYQSVHPESDAAALATEWAKANGFDHVALRDGEVIVSDGGEHHVMGGTSA